MRNKIFFAIVITAFIVLIITNFFVIQVFYKNHEKMMFANLKTNLEIMEQEINLNKFFFNNLREFKFANIEVLLISQDKNIIYTNIKNSNEVFERPEIKKAIKIGEGRASKFSNHFKERTFYYAKKLSDGKILRLSTKKPTILQIFLQNSPLIILIGFSLFVLFFLISFFFARNIVKPINNIDIENIDLENNQTILKYREIKPLLVKINEQKKHLENDKMNLLRAEVIRKDFTANVSHELKTPLQTISGYAELLKSGIAKPEDVLSFSEKIFAESFRMHILVQDIISLTELESDGRQSQWHITNLVSICENVIDSLISIADKKSVSIFLEYDKNEKYLLYSISDVLHTVIYNLIDNAIKYNREGGSIFVNLKKEKKVVPHKHSKLASPNICEKTSISIRDNGIGIESEKLPRIFERFYRADKSRSKTLGGTGLGLSIVKHSLNLLKAEITVKSELGVGTEFIVWL